MYNFMFISRKYRIESLSAGTIDGALRVIKESLFQDESVCNCTEINKNEVAADELLELCADAALDGVSLVAVEIETGEVVSASFNKLKVPKTDSSDKLFFEVFAAERVTQASTRAVIEFMADIDRRCNLFEELDLDCGIEVMFLGTLRPHRNYKLAKTLIMTTVLLAMKLNDGPVSVMTVKDLGPKYSFIPERKPVNKVPKFCQALLTVKSTQHICKTLNVPVYLRVPYTEYQYNGKTFTEILGEDDWCEVVAIRM